MEHLLLPVYVPIRTLCNVEHAVNNVAHSKSLNIHLFSDAKSATSPPTITQKHTSTLRITHKCPSKNPRGIYANHVAVVLPHLPHCSVTHCSMRNCRNLCVIFVSSVLRMIKREKSMPWSTAKWLCARGVDKLWTVITLMRINVYDKISVVIFSWRVIMLKY